MADNPAGFMADFPARREAGYRAVSELCHRYLTGLILATGFSGHGFGIGPAAGRLAADLVTAAPTAVDVQPFVLSRFFDGSKICPVAGI